MGAPSVTDSPRPAFTVQIIQQHRLRGAVHQPEACTRWRCEYAWLSPQHGTRSLSRRKILQRQAHDQAVEQLWKARCAPLLEDADQCMQASLTQMLTLRTPGVTSQLGRQCEVRTPTHDVAIASAVDGACTQRDESRF